MEASHPQEAQDQNRPVVDSEDADPRGLEDSPDADDQAAADETGLGDSDLDLMQQIESSLSGDGEEDPPNVWDVILKDPTLFIQDELAEVSGDIVEAAVGSVPADVDDETEILTEQQATEPVQPEASDDDWSSSVDAGGDSPGMPDHPAPASEDSEVAGLHVLGDAEALPGAFPRDRVMAMMLRKRIITAEQVEQARELAKEHPREVLWRVLARVPGVDRDSVFATASTVYAFTEAQIGDGRPNQDFVRLVMNTFAEEKRDQLLGMGVIPYEAEVGRNGSHRLVFVSHDPARPELQRLLQELKVGRVEIRYAPESDISAQIAEVFPKENEYLQRMTDDPFAVDLGTSYEVEDDLIDEDALEAEISRSTLINLFEASLVEAVRQGASDVHIYPNARRQVEIHFRIDGRLRRWHTEEKVHPEAFLAVVKDNSVNVDRFERDAAQDGFVQRRIDDALIRFRVSVLPIATERADVRAESIVIRVLDDRKVLTDLRKLGMLDVALERFDKAIRQPHGMVILTGPTGSGKSTTLVAALHQVVTPDVNVLTVEDPVEYIIKGVRQIKLNHKLNLEQALRAILRHDPDIVMVGEMRDKDTAELAIKLANTGHLTFSTLHTNDAPSAVSRLYKMGIEPFLISYAINLVVAQRLIRNVCPTCKKVDEEPDRILLKNLGFSEAEIDEATFFEASYDKSCRTCKGTGFKGRRALCETLYFSPAIRHLIVEAGEAIDEDAIRDQAVKEGMLTLQDSARELVKMGETSVDEMIRVTASE